MFITFLLQPMLRRETDPVVTSARRARLQYILSTLHNFPLEGKIGSKFYVMRLATYGISADISRHHFFIGSRQTTSEDINAFLVGHDSPS
jgi:hypothetical protein